MAPMTRVLVTGAGGFIGSTLAEHLVRSGWDVRAMVRYTSHDQLGALAHADRDVADALEVVTGDIRDASAVDAATQGCEVVLHLAAIIAIPYSYKNPREVIDTNVSGTLAVLEAARRHDVRRVVHTSTSEVYGTAQADAITEDHPLRGQSPYSASKIAADKLAEAFYCSFNTPVVTLRPFNTYGPRQSPRAVIPTILLQALADAPVRLGSLAPTRDFTFVDDTVRAFELAATTPGIDGDVIHLGTGREVSIGDVVEMAGKVVGHPLEVIQEDQRTRPPASEVMRLLSDPSKAAEHLGWTAEIDLEAGLRRTAEWLQRSGGWFQLADHAV